MDLLEPAQHNLLRAHFDLKFLLRHLHLILFQLLLHHLRIFPGGILPPTSVTCKAGKITLLRLLLASHHPLIPRHLREDLQPPVKTNVFVKASAPTLSLVHLRADPQTHDQALLHSQTAVRPITSTAGPGAPPETRIPQASSRTILDLLPEEAAWRISSIQPRRPNGTKNMKRKCERKIANANGCNRARIVLSSILMFT